MAIDTIQYFRNNYFASFAFNALVNIYFIENGQLVILSKFQDMCRMSHWWIGSMSQSYVDFNSKSMSGSYTGTISVSWTYQYQCHAHGTLQYHDQIMNLSVPWPMSLRSESWSWSCFASFASIIDIIWQGHFQFQDQCHMPWSLVISSVPWIVP